MTAVVAIVVVCVAFAALCAWIKRSPTTADTSHTNTKENP